MEGAVAAVSLRAPPKNNKKKDAGKSAKKEKDPVNKLGARPQRRSGSKAKFETSSRTQTGLTKQEHTPNSVRRFPTTTSEAQLLFLRDWRFLVPCSGQPFRSSLIKDLLLN